jgi:glycosyltransferase involved in cell wall biosynthesis
VRVGLNLLYLLPGVVGGTETYAAGLLHGLAAVASRSAEFFVYLNRESTSWTLPTAGNFQRVLCPISARSQAARYLYEQTRLPRLARGHRIDVLHSCGYVSPLWASFPTVVTIHDLNYRAFGAQMPLGRRVALQFFVRQSALRSSRVLTVSEFSRQEIIHAFGLPPDRVVVTPNAPRPRFERAGPASAAEHPDPRDPRPYILAFSSRSPNKNIPRLIAAFELARQRYDLPHRLVLVGHSPESGGRPIAASEAVHVAGYLDERPLQSLLAGASLLAFPSLYEGFGLPVVEAMAAGVPVVCSNRASLPEVAGDAASYFDPTSVEDMAAKLGIAARDETLRRKLIERGYRNVRRFSWEESARTALGVYLEVGSGQSLGFGETG